MKIYSWNVNGIRAVVKKGALQAFLSAHQPDVLCLQETKASQGQAEIDLAGYEEYWNSAKKAGYSGTAIFSKTPALSVRYGFPEELAKNYELIDGYGNLNEEGRIVAAEFEKLWVVSVYTPNSKGDLSRLDLRYSHWDPAFLAYMQQLEKTKPVIFCGDLNVAHQEIDLANPKANKGEHGFTDEERERFDDYVKAGFVDTFRSRYPDVTQAYTWWTAWANARARNVGWRIDYVMASRGITDRVVGAQIHADVMGSDHCPVSVQLEVRS